MKYDGCSAVTNRSHPTCDYRFNLIFGRFNEFDSNRRNNTKQNLIYQNLKIFIYKKCEKVYQKLKRYLTVVKFYKEKDYHVKSRGTNVVIINTLLSSLRM